MKVILLAFIITATTNSWAMNLTNKLKVIEISYNEKNKNYDISFEMLAGVYHAEKTHLECLQKSIEKKVEVKVEYIAIGLKIVKCN